MKENINIKKLELDEAQYFIDFFEDLIKETDYLLPTSPEVNRSVEKQEETIRHFDDFKRVFIAKDKNKIIGFVGISRNSYIKNKHVAGFALGVLPKYRRHGIASALLVEAESWLKAHGVLRLEMTVIGDNEPAVRFYLKNGFLIEGCRHKSIFMNDAYYDELYMSKFISDFS